jgi:hypothetical protein
MKKEWITFRMVIGDADGNVVRHENRVGMLAFNLFGFDWIVHSEKEEGKHGCFRAWEITERSTGRRIPFPTPCLERKQAITRALDFLKEKGEAFVVEKIKAIS